MSWIQENKFVAGLAGTTAVITGAILFVGFSQGGAYNDNLEKYEDLKSQYTQLEKAGPYPTEQNLGDRKEGLADYKKTIKEVRDLVTGYRPEKLEVMSPEQFKDARVKMEADLRQKFDAAGTKLPEACAFGFEDYTDGAVKAGATAKLNYQLGAMQWLLSGLADVKPEALNNIRRISLAEEKGYVAPKTKPKGRGKGSSKSRGKKTDSVSGRAYELMPVELSFTATEESVREFLIKMVNSKQYYYALRGVRIRNEKQIAPNRGEVDFPVNNPAPAGGDGFGEFETMEDDDEAEVTEEAAASEEAEFSPGELILKQVLGNEKIHVHVCFDVVLIEKKADEKAGKSDESNAAR